MPSIGVRGLAPRLFLDAQFACTPDRFQLFFCELLYTDKRVARPTGANELIELGLNRGGIAILHVLNEEDRLAR